MYTSTRPRSAVGHPATSPSPLRHASTASSNSSDYSDHYAGSRASNASSSASNGYNSSYHTSYTTSHRRGKSESVANLYASAQRDDYSRPSQSYNAPPDRGRQTTPPRALPKLPPEPEPVAERRDSYFSHSRSGSVEQLRKSFAGTSLDGHSSPPPPPKMAPLSNSLGTISRSDSVRGSRQNSDRPRSVHFTTPALPRDSADLNSFQKSTTGHLRTLSKLANDDGGHLEEELGITSPDQEVVGLHGRRRLQRTMSKRGKPVGSGVGYAGRTWMDTQRQYLQAYEYLCHIGEAKEWIEDIIHKPIPPIVQLEEALRNGITLAEVVQALNPGRNFRIFRHERLQFRHSDNIAIFFNFLAQMELPELFRFELVDLYEKKNIPKVIYCIHALSWLLFRRGIVDFRIGNLVGQLQFEDHELEAMQKGLDRSGVSMPNFGAMSAAMGGEPEEPEETEEERLERERREEEERIERELQEQEAIVTELQAQIRGVLVRFKLGDTMQGLWDSEDWLVDLQSRIRGDFARQIADYKLEMRRFAVNLQSAARGFIIRSREQDKEAFFHENAHAVVIVQKLVRARKARSEVQHLKSRIQRQESGIRGIQAAIRGALKRWDVGDQYQATQEATPQVQLLQAAIRAAIVRKQVDREYSEIKEEEPHVEQLQAAVRGMLQRRIVDDIRDALSKEEPQVQTLQAHARAMLQRRRVDLLRSKLQAALPSVIAAQSAVRGYLHRQATFEFLCELNDHAESIIALQSQARAMLLRNDVETLISSLTDEEAAIVELQTWMRGAAIRRKFAEKQRFYKANMEKVIKLQSFVRGKQQGEAYKILTSGKNPPVGTLKNFVHLLNDSDFDFDEEIGKLWLEP